MSTDPLATTISAGYCPDCSYRGFVLGPRGGVAQNIECGNVRCRARFNVTIWSSEVVLVQRIEREGDGGPVWRSHPAEPA
jgi:hypothetical protein